MNDKRKVKDGSVPVNDVICWIFSDECLRFYSTVQNYKQSGEILVIHTWLHIGLRRRILLSRSTILITWTKLICQNFVALRRLKIVTVRSWKSMFCGVLWIVQYNSFVAVNSENEKFEPETQVNSKEQLEIHRFANLGVKTWFFLRCSDTHSYIALSIHKTCTEWTQVQKITRIEVNLSFRFRVVTTQGHLGVSCLPSFVTHSSADTPCASFWDLFHLINPRCHFECK